MLGMEEMVMGMEGGGMWVLNFEGDGENERL